MKNTALLFLFLGLTLWTMAQSTLIVAHRGFSSIAPENSLAAFRSAIECGAPYFELDVQSSAEGVPMVIHDETLDRTSSSGHRGRVDEFSAEQLQHVRIGYPEKFKGQFSEEPLPTLHDALNLAKGKIKVCVEIKVPGIELAIVQSIRNLKMEEEVVIFSFLPEVLTQIHAHAPDLPLLFLKSDATVNDLDRCKELSAFAIGVGGKTELNSNFVEAAQAKGIQVWRWTVDDPNEMQAMLAIPVDGLISNRPNLALELVK